MKKKREDAPGYVDEDCDLVSRLKDGDEATRDAAAEALVAKYGNALLAPVYSVLGVPDSTDWAEEIVTIGLQKAISGIGQFKFQGATFRNWLVSIVCNEARDQMKRFPRRFLRAAAAADDVLEAVQSREEAVDHGVVVREETEAALRAIRQLPAGRLRQYAELFLPLDGDNGAISAALQISEVNGRQIRKRMCEELRSLLRRDGIGFDAHDAGD